MRQQRQLRGAKAVAAHQALAIDAPPARRLRHALCNAALASFVIGLVLTQPVHAQTKGGTWTKKAPLSVARGEIGAAEVDGKIYALGGSEPTGAVSNLNSMYDPASNTWQDRAPLPKAMHHIGVAGSGGKIFAIGGFTADVHINPQALAFVYDPKANSWSQLPPLSGPRGSVAVAAVDGKVHIFGGRDSRKIVNVKIPNGPEFMVGTGTVTTHEVFDPVSGKWSNAAEVPVTARDHMGIAVLDGKIHLFGGRIDATADLLDRHDVYDPKADTWTQAAPLPQPRSAGAFTVLNGLIVYAGGECKPGGRPGSPNTFEDVTAYDVKTNSWATLAPLPQGRHGFGAGTVQGVAYFAAGAPTCGGGSSADLFALALP